MDSVSAANAASTTARAASTTSTTSTSKTADGKDFATLFADAKRDLRKGETLSKVAGHEYGRIKGGTRDDQCINLSGNARSGQAFDLIWRDGRQELLEVLLARCLRLKDGKRLLECDRLDRRRSEYAVATHRFVRTSNDGADLESLAHESAKRRRREVRRAPEHYAHGKVRAPARTVAPQDPSICCVSGTSASAPFRARACE